MNVLEMVSAINPIAFEIGGLQVRWYGIIIAGSKIADLQSSKNSENQYSGALRFVETIAEDLHVNKEDVYINTEAAKDGAIVKVGDQFYRVLTGDSPEHYLLEKMELQNPKVTIKEAE